MNSDVEEILGQGCEGALADPEAILTRLAAVFRRDSIGSTQNGMVGPNGLGIAESELPSHSPSLEARYRALLDQIPAVVFMAYLDRGISEAYVSPRIEETLGYSQQEWLEDPIRWYEHIHPDDKQRWSVEAAEMFLSGTPLRSSYRVMARDGRVVWFHCEAKLIRHSDGRPWFIHGAAVDITELKQAEEAFEEERDVLSAILDTVGALVVVLDPLGRIVRFNRACEQTFGYKCEDVKARQFLDLLVPPEERDRFSGTFEQLRRGIPVQDFESYSMTRDGSRRLIGWSITVLPRGDDAVRYLIATGIDRTERKQLEDAIIQASGREQRRIGQDLHDGLGQHLTGIAFMSKVLEQTLAEKSSAESRDAAKIVELVNEAISTTRQLARGLSPFLSDWRGLISAFEQWATEVEELFHIQCRFECEDAVFHIDEAMATHLYRIAQEAVHNAVRHGGASHVVISLGGAQHEGVLRIQDDGCGMPVTAPAQCGMGLRIMNYRAHMIGGNLQIERGDGGGTLVSCVFPMNKSGNP